MIRIYCFLHFFCYYDNTRLNKRQQNDFSNLNFECRKLYDWLEKQIKNSWYSLHKSLNKYQIWQKMICLWFVSMNLNQFHLYKQFYLNFIIFTLLSRMLVKCWLHLLIGIPFPIIFSYSSNKHILATSSIFFQFSFMHWAV